MMRISALGATVLLLSATCSEAKFNIVSQVVDGKVDGKAVFLLMPNHPTIVNGSTKIQIDAEKGDLRFDINALSDGKPMQYTGILSSATKRYTTNSVTDGKGECSYYKLDKLPQGGAFVPCIAALIGDTQTSTKDEYKIDMDAKDTKGATIIHVAEDESFRDVEFGVAATIKFLGAIIVDFKFEATEHKLGAPDASVFEVPKEFGECSEEAPSSSSAPTPPFVTNVLKCMGQDSAATTSDPFLV